MLEIMLYLQKVDDAPKTLGIFKSWYYAEVYCF